MNNIAQKKLKHSEEGLAAIIVTMIVMIILSLIVIGFAQLTRREQRQSLDRQLSTQAFYAAETGVNDATDALRRNVVPANQDFTTDCSSFISAAGLGAKSQLNGADFTYSCLLVDQSPTTLDYQGIQMNTSEVVPIQEKNNSPISDITIAWEGNAMGAVPLVAGCPASGVFPADWVNCDTGILRVEFVPFAGPTTRGQLTDNRYIAYLHPVFGGGTNSFSFDTAGQPTGQGAVIGVSCSVNATAKDCTIQLTNINTTKGYLRIFPMYRGADVTICSPTCASPVELAGAQAQIDVTGRAVDVLRRIQVRVPIGTGSGFPEFAAQTYQSLCKRLAIAPPSSVTTPGFGSTTVCGPNAVN